jgi:hypothetical protein
MLFRWFYKTLSSLKTSLWILGAMSICYILGTIFPQGVDLDSYVKAGGRYIWLVKQLNLLNIFISPLFIFLTLLLCLNLLVCILTRLVKFRKRSEIVPLQTASDQKMLIPIPEGLSLEGLQDKLNNAKFKLIEAEDTQYVYGKGLPFWWLSWIYHLGMIMAIAGFFITALTAHEGELTLWKDKEIEFSLYDPNTRLNRFLKRIGLSVGEERKDKAYKIKLKEFRTEYYQTLDFEYPESPLSRLAIGLGFSKIKPSEHKGLSPKMWYTSFVLTTPEGKTIEASTMVNHPFRTDGLTLYQMGYEQRISLRVENKEIEIEIFKPFKIKGLEGRFLARTVKHGKVLKKNGKTEELEPQFILYQIQNGKKKKLANLIMGKETEVLGKRLLFIDFEEASVLSYRVDKGVPLIGIATLLVFVGLVMRTYGNFYRVRIYNIKGKLFLSVSTRGLLADRKKVLKKLELS